MLYPSKPGRARRLAARLVSKLLRLPTLDELERQRAVCHREIDTLEKQQEALCRVLSKIRASLDTETVFRTATKETCRLLRIDRIAVYRFDTDWGGEFVHNFEFAESDWSGCSDWSESPVWNDTCLQETQGGRFRQNEAFWVNDIYEAGLTPCHIEVLEQYQIHAYVAHPIFVGDRLWGLLGAYQHSRPHDWSKRERMYLSLVASQLGLAVKQAQLLEEKQALEQIKAHRALLFGLLAATHEPFELEVLFRRAARAIRKSLQTDRVAIFRFGSSSDDRKGEFVAESVLPAYDSVALATTGHDECFADFYYENTEGDDGERLQAVPDIFTAHLPPRQLAALDRYQVCSQIAIPLRVSGRRWGLLFVQQCDEARHWSPRDLDFVRQVAAHMGIVLAHALLHARLDEQAEDLAEMVRSLARANQELERPGQIDGITGVASRQALDAYLDRIWHALADRQKSLTVVLIDVDFFQQFNETFGQVRGDACLWRVAYCLQEVIASHCPAGMLARYGGAEFAAVLPEIECDVATEIAEKLRQAARNLAIATPEMPDGFGVVTVSVGISCEVPDTDGAPRTGIDCARLALQRAQQEGHNTWRIQTLSGLQVIPSSKFAS